MFYILLILIITLFTNIIIFSNLEDKEIHSETFKKEASDQRLNANLQTKKIEQEQSDYFEKTIFSNTFLAARSY